MTYNRIPPVLRRRVKDELLARLSMLRSQISKKDFPAKGLCNSVLRGPILCGLPTALLTEHQVTEIGIIVLHELFKRWPKFSGNTNYPVPVRDTDPVLGPTKKMLEASGAPLCAIHHAGYARYRLLGLEWTPNSEKPHPIWEGEYGRLRVELLDFMIEALQVSQFPHNTIRPDLNSDEAPT